MNTEESLSTYDAGMYRVVDLYVGYLLEASRRSDWEELRLLLLQLGTVNDNHIRNTVRMMNHTAVTMQGTGLYDKVGFVQPPLSEELTTHKGDSE